MAKKFCKKTTNAAFYFSSSKRTMVISAVVNRADDQTRDVEPILKPSIGTKAPQIATEKGHASDLKKRFEQMAVADEVGNLEKS